MPVLNLPAYPRHEWPNRLQNVMLYPASGLDGPLSDAIVEASRSLTDATEASRPLFDAAMENQLRPSKVQFKSRKMWRGCLAGYVLLLTLARAEAGENRKGVKAAFKKMEPTLKKRKGWKGGGAETDMKTTWRNYRPVAHLWAAQSMGTMFKPGDDPQVLLEWIAGAEDLRHRGEALGPSRAQVPVLDPETMWRMPNELVLPSMGVPLPSVDTIISEIKLSLAEN